MLARLVFHLICVMPVVSARMLNGLSTWFSQIAADQRPGDLVDELAWKGQGCLGLQGTASPYGRQ
jgi:hypothetical protein